MPEISDLLRLLLNGKENWFWKDLGACRNLDTELFFDSYERDPILAAQADEICLNCPVMKACLLSGGAGKETGVWGGVYLTNGKMDDKYNRHKTELFWQRHEEQMGIGHIDE